ncbi:MAG: glutathione S-transferase [Gammaproteobacteria bacterium]|jgi:glutathione S-transferase
MVGFRPERVPVWPCARAVKVIGRPRNLQQCQEFGRAGLAVLDIHLANRDWLAAGQVTIADVACYP